MAFNPSIDPNSLIAFASNIVTGDNPTYDKSTFIEDFPWFLNKVPDPILNQFISMAHATVLEARWHENWRYGMGLFIAHMTSLYMQTMVDPSSSAAKVISAAKVRGLQTTKSVGDISAGYDYATLVSDIKGWVDFKQTQFGLQFIRMARMLGKGGVFIW